MTELVPIPSPGIPVFFGTPGDPVVVIVHDIYGRLPGLVSFAEALASRGLRVAVVDLYDGVCTVDTPTAQGLMGNLDIGTALAEIDDAIAGAQESGDEKVALVGFSLGGWLALLHAQAGAADAVVAYYASLAPQDHGVIPCPVLLHWAETDEWDAGEEPEPFVSRLKDHGTPVTEHRYIGTRHSFANASLPGKVDAQAAALAFARTAVFLEKHLKE
ncbi:dienelactone hydrolase family protein [Salinibacterium soli]|uniref:Dienelactone hydrolase family protein n=1 Tax=Antiquaquibacter soli TaxID=3064523 RepID=A0ABT9BPZ2_9MICO|nr:alpha/beta fold hydrolase [Protaetiibacter sp. WY-16]MDO7883101.1 dienelactone hydrolase family protein [Protaetiibacter sp. WY-16]